MSGLVLFDLDGTLTDSRPGIIACIQHALAALGRPVPSESSLLWCIGPPLRASFVQLLGGEGDADRAVALYRERFGTVGLYENEVYAGVPRLLETLCNDGLRLCVATSKAEVFAVRIVEHFGLGDYFESVFGAELTGERGDKTELLSWVLERTATRRTDATMVGDRAHDMIGARNNGISAVGVLYGYGSRQELIDSGANAVVETPGELVTVFRDG